ncbi:hypothetical protein [Orenia marismortui]|uniref:Uncharacterized protein n=1 Tax=Orenia marismortui TaxID=46469 RepID=A0A4R8GZR6_9FIRM|nr:hypothetical protein [Orenia marismortui]TDX52163.1 hypothetical protein C7959_10885 [Orenia marismortui]
MSKFKIEIEVPDSSLPDDKIDKLFHTDNCIKIALHEFQEDHGNLEGIRVHNTIIIDSFES